MGRRRSLERAPVPPLSTVEAELDHPSGDQAGALTARLARDFELGGEGIEAALGGALADVQDLGDLGASGRTAGEGALAAVGRDQGGSGRALLFVESDAGAAGGDRSSRPARDRIGDFEAVAADDQGVAIAQAARPLERLAVERGAVAAVEVGRHQHPAAVLDLEVVPGDRLVIDLDAGLGIAANDGALACQRHRTGLATLTREPDSRVHLVASIESRPVTEADAEKRIAAEAAAELVEDGMTVGLGTGSTVAHLLPAIAARGVSGIRCVATSVATEEQARGLGIPVEEFSQLQRLDIAIDGTDQVTPDGWLIKGGGGAHLREKIVAAAAERFVVIADSSKPVEALSAPVPLELFAFGIASTLERLGSAVALRDVPHSPDNGLIADYGGEIGDPAELAARLEADPGVAAHGLFPPDMVSAVLVGAEGTVKSLSLS
jgi:ribose 5-phosphate isomerase A